MRIVNRTRDAILAESADLADSLFSRMRGLLGTSELPTGHGLVIEPCNSIHTFFMAYPIDVVFVDKEGRVVKVMEAVKPWRLTAMYPRARSVVELPAGALAGTGTTEGDLIERAPI